MRQLLTSLGLLACLASFQAPRADEAKLESEVRAAAREFGAAFHAGGAETVRALVHPDARLFVLRRDDPKGPTTLAPLALEALIAAAGATNATPATAELLDALPRIACARITIADVVHYAQMTLDDGAWRVRQILRVEARPTAARSEDEALLRAGRDYLAAFFELKPALLETAIHPSLAKYGYYGTNGDSAAMRGMAMERAQLIDLASKLFAKKPPTPDMPQHVEVVDRGSDAGLVRVFGPWGVDLMVVARIGEHWQAVAILWQSPPSEIGFTVAGLASERAVRTTCPFSGRAITADSLCLYKNRVVGFCNPGCRDKFARDPKAWIEKVPELAH
jgi:hypothetical protein